MSWKFNPFTGTFDLVNDLYRGALSSAPPSPASGWMYFNTSDSTLYVYYGSWIAIGSAGPVVDVQRAFEDGTLRNLEDGTPRYIN